jgi:hypothetical protein
MNLPANHSCDPSIFVELPRGNMKEWCIRTREKEVKKGEALTFFYPSTEWDMAQGFDCSCGSPVCLAHLALFFVFSAHIRV